LGDSEVFAVKHTPSHTIPEFGQSSNNDLEVSSFVGREKAWHVFDENNSGAALLNQSRKFVKESRLLPFKPSPRPHSSHRHVLARESSDPDGGVGDSGGVKDFLDVLPPGDLGPVPFEDGRAVVMDFTLVSDTETATPESEVESANAREKRCDSQLSPRCFEDVEEGTIRPSSRLARHSVSAVSHSHTTIRLQPNAVNRSPFSASRAIFRLSFRVQYAWLVFGFLFLLPRRQ
jgi:hypothetical protein